MADPPAPLPSADALRRLAARLRSLPPRPWDAVERSDLEVHGPRDWDPAEQPSQQAHERAEQLRSRRAAWRGLVDASGEPVAGEPLPGGTPQLVQGGPWRTLAELVNDADAALEDARSLWLRTEELTQRTAAAPQEPADVQVGGAGNAAAPDPALLEQAGRAAFGAVPDPAGLRWETLPAGLRAEWVRRAAAALWAVRDERV